IVGLLTVIFGSFVYALSSSGTWTADERRGVQKDSGQALWLTLSLLVLGSLPLADRLLDHWLMSVSGTTFGAIATAVGWFTRKKHNEGQGWRSAAIGIGLTLVSYLLLVFLYNLATRWWLLDANIWWTLPLCIMMVAFSIWIGQKANINRVSMHRYYRDRLCEAFMPTFCDYMPKLNCAPPPAEAPDLFTLTELGKLVTKPYHIINTTLSTNTSPNAKLAGRGGENFIFSPQFCGSPATQYRRTKTFADQQFSLASAFAISGAAVDPDNGVTRFGPLAFLMTLLNIRLGYWCINPNQEKQSRSHPQWFRFILREMLQMHLDEEQDHIHLSDGGHFENLGAYELIRRRCDVVIVGDAGADPGNTFDSLGNLVEIVRVDFGVEISIDTRPMIPKAKKDAKERVCEQPFLFGTIRYPKDESQGHPPKIGLLIYVNTCLFPGLPACVLTYQRMHPEFPEQTTLDQFFDEAQFEAYRELGFRAGLRTARELMIALKLETLPESVDVALKAKLASLTEQKDPVECLQTIERHLQG
ncbi:MAG: hypothetical protein HQL94_06325, partial [Magnetococcales bacterium]|nr:hypothetical protein [Magnetococcales bacterium]